VLDALRRWTLETARQPTATDWGDRRAAGDKWHREHPAWPSHGQVVRLVRSSRKGADDHPGHRDEPERGVL